ncbi:MAG: hypothetical protein AAGK67_06775 [Pseudomonadota bacterium]
MFGWELGKPLELAMGSNAVIVERLHPPITFCQVPEAILRPKDLPKKRGSESQ